jgi:hypothetical protein
VDQAVNSSASWAQIRLTVERDSAAWGPSASARVASTSRVDRPRTNPAITNASNAFVLVTWAPSSWEANRWAVPRTLGRSRCSGPLVVLTVIGWWPAVARLGVWVALVALPTKERGHLSLQRRLQQQAGAKARDVLHDAGQVTGGVGEQLVDLGADALDRRYSCGHGRGSPF